MKKKKKKKKKKKISMCRLLNLPHLETIPLKRQSLFSGEKIISVVC